MAVRGESDGGSEGPGTVGLRPAGSVLAVAGAVWWAVAAGAVTGDRGGAVAWVAAGLVLGGLVLLLARRRLGSEGAHERMRDQGRTYGLVNTAQLVGIVAVVVLAGRAGLPQWIPVGVTAVFAVHFLPFARAFSWRGYTALAVALLGVAAAGAVLAVTGRDGTAVHAVVGPAVAVVLWLTVAAAVLDRPRGPAAPA